MASPPVVSPIKVVSSAPFYGNSSMAAAVTKVASTPAAPVASTPAAPVSMSSASYSYVYMEESSTPAAAVPTAADEACNGATVTVTKKDVTTVTVYPSSVDVKAVAMSSATYDEEDESSTPAAPVSTSSEATMAPVKPTHHFHFHHNSTGYAVPSGFLKMPKQS